MQGVKMKLKNSKSQGYLLQGKSIEKGLHFAMQNSDLIPFSSIYDYTVRHFDKFSKNLSKQTRLARRNELYLLLRKGFSVMSQLKGEYKKDPSNFELKIGSNIYKCRSDFDFKRNNKKICIELKISSKPVAFPGLRHIRQALKYAKANNSVTSIVYLTKFKKNKQIRIKSKIFDVWEHDKNIRLSPETSIVSCEL